MKKTLNSKHISDNRKIISNFLYFIILKLFAVCLIYEFDIFEMFLTHSKPGLLDCLFEVIILNRL